MATRSILAGGIRPGITIVGSDGVARQVQSCAHATHVAIAFTDGTFLTLPPGATVTVRNGR